MRDYGPVAADVDAARAPSARRQALIDAIWNHHGGDGPGRGISWAGFYEIEPDRRSMVLRERRDKPACSPIGLHGACGRCWQERRPLIVRDVAALGEHYIACDPRDRSEVVVPLLLHDGSCWGVLDLAGFDEGAFEQHDARELTSLLAALRLTTPDAPTAALVL